MAATSSATLSNGELELRICSIIRSGGSEPVLQSVIGQRYTDQYGSFPSGSKLTSFLETRKGLFIHSAGGGGGRWSLASSSIQLPGRNTRGAAASSPSDAIAVARMILSERGGRILSGDLGDIYKRATGRSTKPGLCSKLVHDHPHLFTVIPIGNSSNFRVQVIESGVTVAVPSKVSTSVSSATSSKDKEIEDRFVSFLSSTKEPIRADTLGIMYSNKYGSLPAGKRLGPFLQARKGRLFRHHDGKSGGLWSLIRSSITKSSSSMNEVKGDMMGEKGKPDLTNVVDALKQILLCTAGHSLMGSTLEGGYQLNTGINPFHLLLCSLLDFFSHHVRMCR
jgi:hypothetical protein